jgi:putative Ca2+/H+ antiporter (TMEM165/GDT1 family)
MPRDSRRDPGRQHAGVTLDPVAAATTFVLIFPVELPDKTFLVSLVLATRYRPLPVWLGVTAAFFVQCLVAVVAGGLITLLPRRVVLAAAAVLFAAGAFVLLRGASGADAEAQNAEDSGGPAGPASGLRAAATSFGVLFAAEWGDLSQLLTAGLVVRFQDPVRVFVGAWLSLATVAAIAVLAGKTLIRYVSLATIRRTGGVVCAVLAVVSAWEAVTV